MITLNSTISISPDGTETTFPSWSEDDFNVHEDCTFYAALAYKLNYNKENGFYIEIGSNHYKYKNNTYALEKHFNWRGVSLDIEENFVKSFSENRINECLHADAITFDWDDYFKKNDIPDTIDFLSIDIDQISHKHANLHALINLPLTRKKFNVIIIEHNSGHDYGSEDVKELQRKLLHSLGYSLTIRGKTDDVWTLEKPSSNNGFGQLKTLRGMDFDHE